MLLDVATLRTTVGHCGLAGHLFADPAMSVDAVTVTELEWRSDPPHCGQLLVLDRWTARLRERFTAAPSCRAWSGATVGATTVWSELDPAEEVAGRIQTGPGFVQFATSPPRPVGHVVTGTVQACGRHLAWTTMDKQGDTDNFLLEVRRMSATGPPEVVWSRVSSEATLSNLLCSDGWLSFVVGDNTVADKSTSYAVPETG